MVLPSPSSQTANLRILAIGAHPDDIELGCGATLAKYSAQGCPIRAVIFSKGRRGALSNADRIAEAGQSLAMIGVRDMVVCDFPDTRLAGSLNEMVETIEHHVREFSPSRVYTMFIEDRHQDHRAVYEASAVACRMVPQLLGYETPSSYPNFVPRVFEAIDDYLEAKVQALKCHASQGDRLYMQEDKIRAAAHFRGTQVELGLCEGFHPYRLIL